METAYIKDLKTLLNNGTSSHHERREISRRVPSLQIVVFDKDKGGSMGIIKDITEKGLALRRIDADIGERKTLWILGDDLALIDPFELEVECRWVGSEGSEKQLVAGFQVIRISGADLQKLQELLELLDFGCSANS